jgi:hypothetical protein
VPAGWIEREPGQFGRGASEADPTFLVQLGVPGATVDLVTSMLLPRLGLEALPPSSGRFENELLGWDLYAVERQDPEAGRTKGDPAFAQGDAGAYVVLFGTKPDEYDELHYAVFLRAVDALTPLSAGKKEPCTDKTEETTGDVRAEVLLVKGAKLENEASELVARLFQTELDLSTAFVNLNALDQLHRSEPCDIIATGQLLTMSFSLAWSGKMMAVDRSMLADMATLQEWPKMDDTVAMLDVCDVRSGS